MRSFDSPAMLFLLTGFVALASAGCSAGGGTFSDGLPLKISPIKDPAVLKTVKRILYQYPPKDNTETAIKAPKYHDYSEYSHRKGEVIWVRKVRKLRTGENIPGNLADVFYVGTADKAPSTLSEAYSILKGLDPELASRLDACTEHDGFFVFSIGNAETGATEKLYESFCYVKRGRRIYCMYDNRYK